MNMTFTDGNGDTHTGTFELVRENGEAQLGYFVTREADEDWRIAACFYQGSNILFMQSDWQSAQHDVSDQTQVEDARWVEVSTWHPALVLNGAPVLPPFAPAIASHVSIA